MRSLCSRTILSGPPCLLYTSKRFLKGDDRAYTELYNLYIDDLFAYGMHFTTNRESVKDCIQEVFISLYKDRSKQRKVNNIKSYLFVSLKNELFDPVSYTHLLQV